MFASCIIEIQLKGTDPMLCYACVKAFDVIKLSSTRFELDSSCLQVASLRYNCKELTLCYAMLALRHLMLDMFALNRD